MHTALSITVLTNPTIMVPRGFGYRGVEVRCGSTAIDGGVNQCDVCADQCPAVPLPDEDEGDLEYDHRVYGGDE